MSQTEKRSYTLKIANFALAMVLFLDPVLNQAAIAPLSQMTPTHVHEEFKIEMKKEFSLADFRPSTIQYKPQGNGLDLQEMARIGMALQKQYVFNPANVIPTNMPQNSSDQRYVANKVLQHTLETWYSNQKERKNETARTFNTLGSGLDSKGSEDSPISVKFRPTTGKAEITYTGAVEAGLSYDAFDRESKFEASVRWNF